MEVTINNKTITVEVNFPRLMSELIANVNAMLENGDVDDALRRIKSGYYCGVYDMYDASQLAALAARGEK